MWCDIMSEAFSDKIVFFFKFLFPPFLYLSTIRKIGIHEAHMKLQETMLKLFVLLI